MLDNFWMLLAQIIVASFVLMFAISFLLMPVFVLLNNYKEKREKAEMATIILLKQLTQENQDKDFTMEDFLKATKNK
jgi:cbb3-type cytochrome oxidase subunit 3